MSSCESGEGCDLSRSEVLQNCVRDSGGTQTQTCCACPSIGERRERTVAHDERRTGMCSAGWHGVLHLCEECAWTSQ